MRVICLTVTAIFYGTYALITAIAIAETRKGKAEAGHWPHVLVHCFGCLSYSLLAVTDVLGER